MAAEDCSTSLEGKQGVVIGSGEHAARIQVAEQGPAHHPRLIPRN